MDLQLFSVICYIAAGFFFLYGTWTLIRLHWKIGEPWTTHKHETEELRVNISRMDKGGNCLPKDLESTVAEFNKLAKSLRLPPYTRKTLNAS